MANIYEGMNVRQKLAKARLQFLNQKVTKSGKNMHLEFTYFELEDIVPPAIRIFARIGLVTEIDFGDQRGAVMRVYNTDNVDEAPMEFCIPYREVSPIVSNAGKEVTNPLQALGSSVTYLRRYLWMAVLDITEPDDIDATLGEPEEEKKEEPEITPPSLEKPKTEKKSQKKQKAPATPAERKEAKETLTDTDGQADDLQIAALKNACKELMEKDSDQEEFVQKIAMKTNGFTKVTRSQCEQLIRNLGEMIAAYGE